MIDGVTGRPVANAQVRAAPRNIGPSVIAPAVTTDANGLFDISGVGPGAYFVRSSLANGPAGVVPVAPGERNVENVTMLLSAGFTVTGRIVFEGRPANGANPEVSALRVGFAADNRFLPSGVGGATATSQHAVRRRTVPCRCRRWATCLFQRRT